MLKSQSAAAAFLLSLFATTATLRADPVALSTTNNSTVVATATASEQAPVTFDDTTANTVSSLPYATPALATDGLESSTTTPTLTTSDFYLTFSQAAADAGSSDSGAANLFFLPGNSVQYTLTGTATTNYANGAEISASLHDLTTGTYLYDQSITGNSTSILDNSGGPLTGSLTSGDLYEYLVTTTLIGPPEPPVNTTAINPDLSTADTVAGTFDLSFTQVPEPASAAIFLLGSSLLQFTRRRRPRTVPQR